MVLEIALPIAVAIGGGIGSAVVGAYGAAKDGEDFSVKKFVLAIPKSVVGAILALGALQGSVDVTTLTGFLAIFGVGFTANVVLSKLGPKAKGE